MAQDKHGNQLKTGDKVWIEARVVNTDDSAALVEAEGDNAGMRITIHGSLCSKDFGGFFQLGEQFAAGLKSRHEVEAMISQDTPTPMDGCCCIETTERVWLPSTLGTVSFTMPWRPHSDQFALKLARRLPGLPLFENIDQAFWQNIITQLLPILIACFQPTTPAGLKRYLKTRKDFRGDYRRGLIRRGARAALQASERNITWEQAQQLAAETFDQVLATDDNTLALAMREW